MPLEIGNLSSLEVLNLGYNSLTSISSEIGKLSSLKRLDVRDNSLNDIPSEIGNLHLLEELYILNNNISNIPSEIGNLILLENIFAMNNKITNLPAQIGNLSSLKMFLIYSNLLTNLPNTIVNLSPEDQCDLSYNKLDSNSLSNEVKQWADIYDPDWRLTQNISEIINLKTEDRILPFKIFFNYTTSNIQLCLSFNLTGKLEVFDIKGRFITSLFDGYIKAGIYKFNFNTKDYPATLYIFKLTTHDLIYAKKLFFLK